MTKESPDISTLTREEEDAILAAYSQRVGGVCAFESMEDLLVSPDGFGLTTATRAQRACCRIMEGRALGDLAEDPTVKGILGYGELPEFDRPPLEVHILAAIRTGKSMMAALRAIWATQNCDLSMLSHGEIPRYAVISLELDNARVVFSHLLGALQQPRLAALRIPKAQSSKWNDLISETGSHVIGSEFLWHPSGRPVEIRVVAGKRAGGSIVSRWLLGFCLDEAPRMVGSSDAVVNFDDTRRAGLGRLLPGGQILAIGSPWQPFGPVYDTVQEHWGAPTKDIVVIKANGPAMNPQWWTPDRCEHLRQHDPKAYQTDVLADFADAEEQLYPQKVIKEAIRTEPIEIPWMEGRDYVAAIDPATRNNAWTLVVFSRVGVKKQMVCAREWQGSSIQPLRPKEVLEEIAEVLESYGLDWTFTDQWSADALRDIAEDNGLTLVIEDWTKQGKIDAFLSLGVALANGTVELAPHPNVERDLKMVKRRASTGGITIQLPKTTDGRHCDFAAAIARALVRWLEDEDYVPPEYGTDEYWSLWEQTQIDKEEETLKYGTDNEWWEDELDLRI